MNPRMSCRLRNLAIAIVAVGLVVGLGACGDDDALSTDAGPLTTPTTSPASPTSLVTSDETLRPVITQAPAEFGEEGMRTGRLLERDGCFYLASEGADAEPGDVRVLVFESGTTWDVAAASIVNPDGTTVPIGTQIEVGGGDHDIADLAPYFVNDLGPIEDCGEVMSTSFAYVVTGSIQPSAE